MTANSNLSVKKVQYEKVFTQIFGNHAEYHTLKEAIKEASETICEKKIINVLARKLSEPTTSSIQYSTLFMKDLKGAFNTFNTFRK